MAFRNKDNANNEKFNCQKGVISYKNVVNEVD